MRFFFFTKADKNIPSSRYRAYYIAEELQKLGYQVQVMPASDRTLKGFLHYCRVMLGMKRDDVLYLQRTVYNKFFLLALCIAWICGKRFIFDIDDAVYEHSRLKTELLTRGAEFVTCGSQKIREWTIKRNKRSFVLTNSIPLEIYTPRNEEPTGLPVIGWIGTLPEVFMRPSIEGVKALAASGKEFELKVIGAMGNPEIRSLLAGVPHLTIIDSLNWSDPREAVREIKTFTIGIMPLSDSPWDQVKYFKALEYMACSVPVVASPGVTVKAILEKFQCGEIAGSTDEWVSKLTQLLDDAPLRKRMGEKGRLGVESTYSVNAITQQFLSYIDLVRHSKR